MVRVHLPILALCFICVADMFERITVNLKPREANVPLNEVVNFTCQGTGEELQWQVNGAELDSNTIAERGIAVTHISTVPGNLLSILTITASPKNNNIGISCQMIKNSTRELKRNSSILYALGISPVTGINYDPVTCKLSWSRPSFYSKDVRRTVDIIYIVKVNGTVFETTDTHLISCDLPISIKACAAQYCSVPSKIESGCNVTALGLINGNTFTWSCVPSEQIHVTHTYSTNDDNVNTKGVSTSSTTAIAPATSLPTAPRTATSAPTTTSIITTEITPATFCTALTSTADANGPSTTSSIPNKNYAAGIIAGCVVAAAVVIVFAVIVAVVSFVVRYRKRKLHVAQKDPTAQVDDTSDQPTIAEASFATSSSNEGSELAMCQHVSPSTELVNDGSSKTVATDPRLGRPEMPPSSSLNGEDCNESRYDSTSQEETTTGGKNSQIVSSLSPVPQESKPLELNEAPVRYENSSIEYELKKFTE